jgi:hypothetical protein
MPVAAFKGSSNHYRGVLASSGFLVISLHTVRMKTGYKTNTILICFDCRRTLLIQSTGCWHDPGARSEEFEKNYIDWTDCNSNRPMDYEDSKASRLR